MRSGLPRATDAAHAVLVQGGALRVPTSAYSVAVAPQIRVAAKVVRIARRLVHASLWENEPRKVVEVPGFRTSVLLLLK